MSKITLTNLAEHLGVTDSELQSLVMKVQAHAPRNLPAYENTVRIMDDYGFEPEDIKRIAAYLYAQSRAG